MYKALGLMSGTSMDGIDAAVIETDGESVVKPLGGRTSVFDPNFRKALMAMQGRKKPMEEVETAFTLGNAEAVKRVLKKLEIDPSEIDVIGFHGQTLYHAPDEKLTVQMGDGGMLATETEIPVVYDFRSADVQAGGQGAPLAPIYHMARCAGQEKPMAVLNLGGVGNITYIGKFKELIAFDTGPANGPIDDWVGRHGKGAMDEGGIFSLAGQPELGRITHALRNPYFRKLPPKSLDRSFFGWELVKGLSLEDGCATLARLVSESVAQGRAWFPDKIRHVLVGGGGRYNQAIMKNLSERLDVPVRSCDEEGWDGDLIEAEAFAYMAVRHLRGLPITYPDTTGVSEPLKGGRLAMPAKKPAAKNEGDAA